VEWLQSLSAKKKIVKSQIFVFDDELSPEDYALQINSIVLSKHSSIISEEKNWDQTGILSILLTWEEEKE